MPTRVNNIQTNINPTDNYLPIQTSSYIKRKTLDFHTGILKLNPVVNRLEKHYKVSPHKHETKNKVTCNNSIQEADKDM